MRKLDRTIDYYSDHADHFCQIYESHPFEAIHSHWLRVISLDKKIRILDVGSGSGRDASWFAQKGHEVIAVEPARGLRTLAKKIHPDVSIQWLNDCLPGLQTVKKLQLRFDLILLNAVWMHLTGKDRKKAFCTLMGLLQREGCLVITLRHGPSSDARMMYPVCRKELIDFSEAEKSQLILDVKSDDLFGRTDVSWETLVFQLP